MKPLPVVPNDGEKLNNNKPTITNNGSDDESNNEDNDSNDSADVSNNEKDNDSDYETEKEPIIKAIGNNNTFVVYDFVVYGGITSIGLTKLY